MPRTDPPLRSLPPRPKKSLPPPVSPELDQHSLAEALEQLRVWSGVKLAALKVPTTTIKIPTSTSWGYLNAEAFPPWAFVYTLVITCLTNAGLNPATEIEDWGKAWSHVKRQVKERRKDTPRPAEHTQQTPEPAPTEHHQPAAAATEPQQEGTPKQTDSNKESATPGASHWLHDAALLAGSAIVAFTTRRWASRRTQSAAENFSSNEPTHLPPPFTVGPERPTWTPHAPPPDGTKRRVWEPGDPHRYRRSP